jgi:hypothetical protein
MWDILKEHTTGKKGHEKIDKLTTDSGTIIDDLSMANEFNRFFSEVGLKISNSVEPTNKLPDEYLHTNNANPVPLSFGSFS